jgi:carbon-monoxide dehydrogenase medium subunit
MLALGATFVAKGPKGERTISAQDFFTDLYTTLLQPDEILIEIRIPVPSAGNGGAYIKLERKVGDFAIAAVAAQVTLDAKGICGRAGIGLTNVGLVPVQARKAEQSLIGKECTETHIAAAAKLAAEESQPRNDFRGTEEYKRDLVRVLTARALRRAAERAKGGK